MRPTIESIAAKRAWPVLFALLAGSLTLPAVTTGLFADDYIHRTVLLQLGEMTHPVRPVMDLFAFVRHGEPAEAMRQVGYLPWWSDPDMHASLFRPLSALTHVLDYALWPDGFALQHLHSLAWFAVGVFLVGVLYRCVPAMSPPAAALAGLLFAVEDAHALPAGWLANRNALLCLVFGAAVLICHLRWRGTGKGRWLALALLLFATGLGCGEATLGALGYVAAWQLTMEPKQPRVRSVARLLPYVGLVFLWRLLYDALDYGVTGSRLYVDPAQHPLLFAGALAERWPLLAFGQWVQAPLDLWALLGSPQRIVVSLVAAVGVAALIWLLWPLLHRPVGRFWALGMALSLVPLCAAFPMDRLLIFAGIGAFGLLGLLADAALFGPTRPAGWRRPAVVVLLVLHGPIAATLLVVRITKLPAFGQFFTAAAAHSPRGPEVPGQTFVFVNGNDFPVTYCRLVRVVSGEPAPRRVVQLASMLDTNRVVRTDANTLVVTPEGGFFAHPLDQLFARESFGYREGERIELPDFQAEILSLTRDGRPATVAFRFRQDPGDASLRWLYWKDRRLQEFSLPEVGSSVVVPPVTLSLP